MLTERTGHTRKDAINKSSIAIALAGNFTKEDPTPQQLRALRSLVSRLDSQFNFTEIAGHKNYSPTSCPGDRLLSKITDLIRITWKEYQVSRYYTPIPGQKRYYRDSYEADFKVNCQGDCLVTANGYHLKPEDAYKVAACPPEMPFGTKLDFEGMVITCVDRGSAIKGDRIDIWAGIGMTGLNNILTRKAGKMLAKPFDPLSPLFP